MKKVAFFLTLAMFFCTLFGCSDSDSQNKETDGIWSIQKVTDDFGDAIKSSQDIICAEVQGTYETKTTTGSKFSVSVNLKQRADFNHFIIEFQLTENGTSKIQFEKTSTIKLKTKVGDAVKKFYLSVDESGGKLSYGNEEVYKNNDCGEYFFSTLYNGQDIKCVIEQNASSSYSFELKSDNFKSLCEVNGIPLHYTEAITVKDSVEFLLSDNREKTKESCDYLISKYKNFEVIETEELQELMNGVFLRMSLEPIDGDSADSCRWFIDEYAINENILEVSGIYSVSYGELERKKMNGIQISPYRIKAFLDLVHEDNYNYGTFYEREIRRITDDIFISYSTSTDSSTTNSGSYSLFVYLGESFNESDLRKQIEYALENYVPKISY